MGGHDFVDLNIDSLEKQSLTVGLILLT